MKSCSVRKVVYFGANPEAVFDPLTSRADIVRYCPLQIVSADWQLGGEILLDVKNPGKPFDRRLSLILETVRNNVTNGTW